MKKPEVIFTIVVFLLSGCHRQKIADSSLQQQSGLEKTDKSKEKAAANGKPLSTVTHLTALAGDRDVPPSRQILSDRKSDNFENASKRFGEYLKSNGCVGMRLSNVKAEFGDPDAETARSITYRFEAGYGGWDWTLQHDGQRITSYSRNGVN